MATIDAAIIKALVEHIGGNPDTIPDGTIGGGSNAKISFINCEWSVSNDKYVVKLPFNVEIGLGTCVKLNIAMNDGYLDTVFYCSKLPDVNNTFQEYTFSTGQDDASFTLVKEGFLNYTSDIEVGMLQNVPDNETTGMFNLTGSAEISECIKQLIARMHNILDKIN